MFDNDTSYGVEPDQSWDGWPVDKCRFCTQPHKPDECTAVQEFIDSYGKFDEEGDVSSDELWFDERPIRCMVCGRLLDECPAHGDCCDVCDDPECYRNQP